jgi:hypothetical protein
MAEITKVDKNTLNLLWSLFILHAVICIVANFLLLFINLIGDFRHPWFFWPLIIWGLILYGHFRLNKLIIRGFFQEQWEQLIEKLSKA